MTMLSSVSIAAFMSWILIGSGDDSRERSPSLVCQYVPLGPELAPISGVWTGRIPPKGALTELESNDCHFHLIPLTSSYLWRSLIHIFSNLPSFLDPLLEPSVTCRAFAVFPWNSLPLAFWP